MTIENRMKEIGYPLPEVTPLPPGFNFVSVLVYDHIAYVSGSMPFVNGSELLYTGKVGDTVSIEEGRKTAELCILNALASVKEKIGSLDKIDQILKITGFVGSASGFTDQASVMHGATDLLIKIFGDRGVHSRTAVGVAVMPLNTPVEIEMVIALKKDS